MDSYFRATRPYYMSYKICRSCALCYDENYNIEVLKYRKISKKLYLEMLMDNDI
jgi:hypothetical protein